MSAGRAIGLLAASATLTLRRIRGDQRQIWSSPRRITQPALGILGITAALIALDPVTAPGIEKAASTPALRRFNSICSGRNMAFVINGAPLLFFLAGVILRRPSLWKTAWLAGEAIANAEIVAVTAKHLDRRVRPLDVGVDGDYRHTWFRTKRRDIGGAGCFPSGHTASAFAGAAVFANRYPRYQWLAWLCAGSIGASRMTTRAHYPSDVFAGAALGYSVGHFVVVPRAGLMYAAEHPDQQHNQENCAESDTSPAACSPTAIAVIPATTAE